MKNRQGVEHKASIGFGFHPSRWLLWYESRSSWHVVTNIIAILENSPWFSGSHLIIFLFLRKLNRIISHLGSMSCTSPHTTPSNSAIFIPISTTLKKDGEVSFSYLIYGNNFGTCMLITFYNTKLARLYILCNIHILWSFSNSLGCKSYNPGLCYCAIRSWTEQIWRFMDIRAKDLSILMIRLRRCSHSGSLDTIELLSLKAWNSWL